jgi:hypothetical protein
VVEAEAAVLQAMLLQQAKLLLQAKASPKPMVLPAIAMLAILLQQAMLLLQAAAEIAVKLHL